MKKPYKTPSAEKMEFDYSESVEACSPWCTNPNHNHPWNCGNSNVNPNPPDSTPTPTPDPNNQYYAPGWGQNCS